MDVFWCSGMRLTARSGAQTTDWLAAEGWIFEGLKVCLFLNFSFPVTTQFTSWYAVRGRSSPLSPAFADLPLYTAALLPG